MDYIDDYCSESKSLEKLFKTRVPDPRMRDMDLILRFFVMTKHIEEYKGNYKQALDSISDYYNKTWDRTNDLVKATLSSFEKTIELAFEVFGEDGAFRRPDLQITDNRVNRALFDIVCYYFSQIGKPSIIEHKESIIKATKDLCQDNSAFLKSISSNTNNLKETSSRFTIYGEAIQSIIGKTIQIPNNLKTYYSKIR